MSFQLHEDESIARGLRRLARKELKSARGGLRRTTPPSDEAIREARKSVKKVRAIAAAIDADDGRGVDAEQKQLRKVNRMLSNVRDADARLEILAKLEQRAPNALDEHTFARLRRELAAHKHESKRGAGGEDAWKKVSRRLRKLRRGVDDWRPAHSGFGALAAGIHEAHRRGRKRLARARRGGRADDFHDWRKAAKALWYVLRLIEPASAAIRRDVRALHRAERWLGDDHNIELLCCELERGAAARDLAHLRHAASHYQRELRRKALAATRAIYRRRPSDYVRSIRRAWKKSRHAVDSGGRGRRAA
jgi:CHAD domain-containing protein